jgi:hypothetical protein
MATINVSLRLITAPPAPAGDFQWALDALQISVGVSILIGIVAAIGIIAAGVFAAWMIPLTVVTLIIWKRLSGPISTLAKRIT